jgi:ankyrin repeat protein
MAVLFSHENRAQKDKSLAADMLRRHPQLLQNSELLSNRAMSDVETCLWLVQQGYDINTPNRSGQTVLRRYASRNKPDALAMLVTHGADPDAREMNLLADEATQSVGIETREIADRSPSQN